ncbi:hypothetical protein K457DRAFT_130459 [Linnemannia elongata AG-77]|uniref:Uncharacterized protein n=1 Tax=Linnemannia elongata AG-77 TaxID=1314771 RepID=A0A197JEK2_9FUNG|nr:hypothetical protein K457DRAFT_130459 [Linnemannia elongata AG-77]
MGARSILASFNLTYQERINGGLFNRVKYLFFTKFPQGRRQYLGRFYVALALVISFALNYLPTLLSDIYPVTTAFPESKIQEMGISTAFTKTTSLQPNKTSVEDILSSVGVELAGRRFDGYKATLPPPLPCKHSSNLPRVNCSSEEVGLGIFHETNWSLVIGFKDEVNGSRTILSATTPDGEQFQYFNTTVVGDDFTLVRMFLDAGVATSSNFDDMSLPSPRSLESCLVRGDRTHRCVRHSLGYLLSKNLHTMLITRRVFTQTLYHAFNGAYDTDKGPFQPNETIAAFDCKKFPTTTLITMCTQLLSLESPFSNRMHSMQQVIKDPDGSFHWDVMTFRVVFATNNLTTVTYLSAEAFHLDIGAMYYNTTVNLKEAAKTVPYSNRAILQFRGRETFEATYILNFTAVPYYNHSWIDWGFSDEDTRNLTDFLLRGTILNNGAFVMRNPALMADVSGLVVALFLLAAALMVGLGFLVSREVDSMVHDPITEILPQVLDLKHGVGPREDANANLRTTRVANLKLVSSTTLNDNGPETTTANANTTAIDSQQQHHAEAKRSSTIRRRKIYTLRMEVDTDDELDAFDLFEYRNDASQHTQQ